MRDAIRISVGANDDEQTVSIHGDEGRVEAGDATFTFSVGGTGGRGSESANGRGSASDAKNTESIGHDARRIAPLDDVPVDGTLRCEALDGRRGVELVLRREGDAVVAWRNSCPHEPKVRLDPGDGAIVTDDHVVCHKHGARFQRGDGLCTHGPCRGAALDAIAVDVRGGDVYLIDDRFEACRRLDG